MKQPRMCIHCKGVDSDVVRVGVRHYAHRACHLLVGTHFVGLTDKQVEALLAVIEQATAGQPEFPNYFHPLHTLRAAQRSLEAALAVPAP